MSTGSFLADMISYLPSCLIENILSRLTLRDAARTSILSRKWRNQWLTLRTLAFDDSLGKNFTGSEPLAPKIDELFKIIYQILLQRHDEPIHNFTLSFAELESCPEIDFLIYFLSKINIQELTLRVSSSNFYHTLPSYFFSCLRLNYLQLCGFLINPLPAFEGFSQLTIVHFKYLKFAGAGVLEAFVSNCPLLEELTVVSCENINNLMIDAPRLKLLHYEGIVNSICFKRATFLAKVAILTSDGDNWDEDDLRISGVNGVLASLSAIEEFNIGSQLFLALAAAQDVTERLSAPLDHLKSLTMQNVYFPEVKEFSCALCLMRSSPNLQELKIKVYHECGLKISAEGFLESLHTQDFSNANFDQLVEVRMENFKGTMPEMEFLRILLGASPVLQRLRICYAVEDVEQENRFLIELVRFRRASPKAEIFIGRGSGSDDCASKSHTQV